MPKTTSHLPSFTAFSPFKKMGFFQRKCESVPVDIVSLFLIVRMPFNMKRNPGKQKHNKGIIIWPEFCWIDSIICYKSDNLEARKNWNKKKKLPRPPLKNWPTHKKNLLSETNKKPNLRFKDDFVFALGCLTVCVTRAGAGGGTPSDWENDKT